MSTTTGYVHIGLIVMLHPLYFLSQPFLLFFQLKMFLMTSATKEHLVYATHRLSPLASQVKCPPQAQYHHHSLQLNPQASLARRLLNQRSLQVRRSRHLNHRLSLLASLHLIRR